MAGRGGRINCVGRVRKGNVIRMEKKWKIEKGNGRGKGKGKGIR